MNTKIKLYIDDGYFEIEPWTEVSGYVQIKYVEDGMSEATLPFISKKEWETLKRNVDFVFENRGE